jgi:uncharacterized protein
MKRLRRCIARVLAVGLAFLWAIAAPPVVASEPLPRIAIIIDDIGDRHAEGLAAVMLPGPVSCAFLPHTPYARMLARRAHAEGKDVLLHLPLQALEGKELGPGAISLHSSEAEFQRVLQQNIAAIPHIRGVNNHMGSLLTRHPGHMTWLMRDLAKREGMYFVDSYTHPGSVALAMAQENGVPAARRDVFLDNVQEHDAIDAEFRRLVERAKRNGSAIGIGHPYPATLTYLADVLPQLEADFGVRLVGVSEILAVGERSRLGDVPAGSASAVR